MAEAMSTTTIFTRTKTTFAQYVAARHRDPTFEKLMDSYKHLLKVLAIQDLILASPSLSLPLPLLLSPALAHRLRLNPRFLRSFPHVFSLDNPDLAVRLTPAATEIARRESIAAAAEGGRAVDRIQRLLSISTSRSLPLRAIFKIWRELGLPDDFEDSVLRSNRDVFELRENPSERNTHILALRNPNPTFAPAVEERRQSKAEEMEILEFASQNPIPNPRFTPAVEEWRARERAREGSEEMGIRFAFKQGFPPGMKLSKGFRARVKEWQRRPYTGPYEVVVGGGKGKKTAAAMEKRAVGIAHEFLSLTVEKMVEVEKISQFRKWFGIELNVRDLFLDHPGIFYLSTKGKRHTVFLREAYDRGRLVESNLIYEERMRLLDLVRLRRRGIGREGLGEEEEVANSDDDDDNVSFCEE